MNMLRKSLRKVQNLRLFVKIILIILASNIAQFVIEIGGRDAVYQAYDEQLYLRTAQVLTSYVNQMEAEFDKFDTLTLSIIGDSGIQKNLKLLKKNEDLDRVETMKNIRISLASYAEMQDCINMMGILSPESEMVVVNRGRRFITDEESEKFIHVAREKEGSLVLISEEGYIWAVRQIRQIENMSMDELGIIVIRIDLSDIFKNINASYEKIGMMPDLIINDGETCIYSSLPDEKKIQWSQDTKQWDVIDGQFVVRTESRQLGWRFYGSIPYAQVKEAINEANSRSLFIAIMAICILIISCGMLIKGIIRHIGVLQKKFIDFGEGILPNKAVLAKYKERTDEIGILHQQFDKMAVDYKRISDENFNNMLLLKEAQFNELQSQMQPHFLFNAISIIVWSAYDNDDEVTADIADALGQILRYSIHHRGKMSTIREEMNVVESYIFIQKFRYANRFSVQIEMPKEIEEVSLPPFTLQPIVENIMVHVVEKTLDHCYICIKGQIVGETAEIVIEDSGNLLESDTLLKLETGEKRARGNGVGLQNINSRIKLLFSEKYGIQIENDEGVSRVIVRIPANKTLLRDNAEG